jgi:hypothetical protein
MLGVGTNRIRAGRLSRHRTDRESRRVPNDRMLWKWNSLKRFAPFPKINSVLSNLGELRWKSRHVVGFSFENRPPMTRRDGASEFPHSNEGCKHTQCGTTRTPLARRPEVAGFKSGSPTELQRHCLTFV